MVPYHEFRARRLWAAYTYEGWGMPPYPGPGPNIGRLVTSGPHAGLHLASSASCSRLNANALAQEKMQNRRLL